MDVIAFVIAVVGITLAARGRYLIGIALIAISLSGLAILLGRAHKPKVLLPFSFVSWFAVLSLALVAAFVLPSYTLSPVPLGLAFYYFGCVALSEKKVRYAPWGSGFYWREASRRDRPMIFWLIVTFSFLMGGLFIAAGVVAAVRAA